MPPELNPAAIASHAEPSDVGSLVNNGAQIRMLQSALSRMETNTGAIPSLVGQIIRRGAWLRWMDANGQEFAWTPAEFRRFIEDPRPKGCQARLQDVRDALKGNPDVLCRFEELIRGEPGGANNPGGLGGKSGKTADDIVNRDNITVDNVEADDAPDTIPIRPRDYSREAPTGTSTSYALRRLRKEAPELLDRVHAGELTPNAAMVKAGLRRPHLQVKDDPESLASYLLRKWDRERIATLLARLADALTD